MWAWYGTNWSVPHKEAIWTQRATPGTWKFSMSIDVSGSAARLVAEKFATQHTEFVVRPQAIDLLPQLVWHYGEPYADSSALPTYVLSELTRRHVTVVLTGEGSDELLAGYGKYLRAAWNWRAGLVYEHLVPGRIRRAIAEGIVPLVPSRLGHYARRSCLAIDRSPESMFFDGCDL